MRAILGIIRGFPSSDSLAKIYVILILANIFFNDYTKCIIYRYYT